MNENIQITKASGEKAPFEKGKLKNSLLRAGASSKQADVVVDKVINLLEEGMSTKKIYKTAFRLLRNMSHSMAARYKLKQAIMELGPSGFPFEVFMGELIKSRGYIAKIGVIVEGHCVNHEVDVLAEKEDHRFMVECKFHNKQGYICDVKVPLYIQSRFADIRKQWEKAHQNEEMFYESWVATNTRFSEDAIKYGNCMNMHLLGWDYPKKNGLKEWIDNSGLHPITCLTTLTSHEKKTLLNMKVLLSRDLHKNPELLQKIGIKKPRLDKVINESLMLCRDIEIQTA
jgi:hypothetical protein